MNASDSTPLIVPLNEFQVCLTLTAMWQMFRERNRIREIWEEDEQGPILSHEAFMDRAKFLRIMKANGDASR